MPVEPRTHAAIVVDGSATHGAWRAARADDRRRMGGQRLHLYADYLAALEKANLPLEPFEYYLEAFRYGMPPEGGFAIGLERLLMQLTGAPNIRLTTLFPRDLSRLTP